MRVGQTPMETGLVEALRSTQFAAVGELQPTPLSAWRHVQPAERPVTTARESVEHLAADQPQAPPPGQSTGHGMGLNERYRSDIGLSGEDLAKLDEDVRRAIGLRAEAIKAAASMRLLIAGEPSADRPHEVPFLTPELYETRNGRWPSAAELDEASVLIKDHQGNYLSKADFYRGIKVNPQLSKAAQRNARDRKFAKEMEALGLSSIHFGANRHAIGEECIYQTPAGERERERVFEYPLQAGATAPDMMVRDGNGKHIGIYPKLDPDARSSTLKIIRARFGPGNVWLKTAENSYETVGFMNDRKPNSAEQAFADFKREPMPKVLVEKLNGAFVSKEMHDEMLKEQNPAVRLQMDPAKQHLLILSEQTKSYVTPRALRNIHRENPQDFERALREAGLPNSVTAPLFYTGPLVLVRSGRDVFVPGERFQGPASQGLLNFTRSNHDIYVQNIDRRGNYTGSYTSLARLEQAGRKPNRRQLGQLGLAAASGPGNPDIP